MCMEDIRLGRAKQQLITLKSIALTVNPLCDDSPLRTTLILSSHTSRSYWVSDNPNMASGEGLFVPTNTQAIKLSVEDAGTFVTKALYTIGNGAGTIAVLETILPKQ